MLWVWCEQIESGTVLDEFSLNPPVLCHLFHSREVYSFFQVDRNQCFYFQFSSVATSGFFFASQNSATWWQTKRPLRKFKCSYLEKKVFSELCACHVWKGMRFHSSGSWGLGGWLGSFPFVNFIPNFDLVEYFWGLVGFVMRSFFLVTFIFLMLCQWWSSITRWIHFIYINAKNFWTIHQDVKICCTKINIVCKS